MVILMIPIVNFITVLYILYRTGQKVEGIQTAKIKTIEISDGRNIFSFFIHKCLTSKISAQIYIEAATQYIIEVDLCVIWTSLFFTRHPEI